MRQGETARFDCNAMAEPIQSVRWEREGVVIAQFLSPDDRERSVEAFCRLQCTQLQRNVSVTIEDRIQLAGLGASYGQLTIVNTNSSDARGYTCYVGNVYETLSAGATLTVQGEIVKVVDFFTSLYPLFQSKIVLIEKI